MNGSYPGVLNINLFTFKIHCLIAYAAALQMQVVRIDTECGFVYSAAIEACRLCMDRGMAFVHSWGGRNERFTSQVSHSKRDTPLTFRLKSSTSISLAWKSATPGIYKSLISGAVT